jgi:hypothetical protein
MRGAPAKAIQELARHENLSTTQRYMHLSPAAMDAAICLLDVAASRISGDIRETEISPTEKPRSGKDEGPGTLRFRALLFGEEYGT